MDPVERYFSSVSEGYDQRGSRFPWRLLRESEAEAIGKALPLQTPKRILEVGCGSGFYTRIIRARYPDADIVCLDKTPSMLERVNLPGVRKIAADFLDFGCDDTFDLVLGLGVAEFVGPLFFPKLAQTMDRSSGLAILLVPDDCLTAALYRKFHLRNRISVDLFGAKRLIGLGLESGLAIESERAGLFSRVARARLVN